MDSRSPFGFMSHWASSPRFVMREPIDPGETPREDLDALGMSAAEGRPRAPQAPQAPHTVTGRPPSDSSRR